MIDMNLFNEFVCARIEGRKPMTERAKAMLLRKLDACELSGHCSTKLIENAIIGGWMNIYPNKDTKKEIGFIEKHTNTDWANEMPDNVRRLR